MIDLINVILFDFFKNLGSFMPNLFGGLLILIVGLLIGGIVKHLIVTVVTFSKIDLLFHKTKLIKKEEVNIWTEVLSEILKWMLIIVFSREVLLLLATPTAKLYKSSLLILSHLLFLYRKWSRVIIAIRLLTFWKG